MDEPKVRSSVWASRATPTDSTHDGRKPRRMEPRRLQPTTDSTRHEVTRDGFKPNGSNPPRVQPHQNQPPDSTHHGFNPQRIQPHDGFNLRWMQTMVRPSVTSRAVRVRPNTRSPAFWECHSDKNKDKEKENKKTETKKKNRKGKKKDKQGCGPRRA